MKIVAPLLRDSGAHDLRVLITVSLSRGQETDAS